MLTVFLVSILTLVQLNCENLFDCSHDEGKNDTEFTAEGKRHWTKQKYWQKTENIAKELIGCCGKDTLPDLITLCEVENDTVMERLTRRTAMGQLGYRYIMTNSRDERGIDVELVADEWCNTLEDIKYFADNKAGHMVQIKTPDLGGINNIAEAVIYCKEKGIGAYQGGTCNETDRSAQVCVDVAMATQPDQILAKPGMGVDEGYMIVFNEMQRVLAMMQAKNA